MVRLGVTGSTLTRKPKFKIPSQSPDRDNMTINGQVPSNEKISILIRI